MDCFNCQYVNNYRILFSRFDPIVAFSCYLLPDRPTEFWASKEPCGSFKKRETR